VSTLTLSPPLVVDETVTRVESRGMTAQPQDSLISCSLDWWSASSLLRTTTWRIPSARVAATVAAVNVHTGAGMSTDLAWTRALIEDWSTERSRPGTWDDGTQWTLTTPLVVDVSITTVDVKTWSCRWASEEARYQVEELDGSATVMRTRSFEVTAFHWLTLMSRVNTLEQSGSTLAAWTTALLEDYQRQTGNAGSIA
jgi:hypothetical protein